jgi:hypothetical protein
MEYYNWQTIFDEYRKFHKKDKFSDKEIFYIESQNILSTNFRDKNNMWKRMIRLCCEYMWIKNQRPYYNIHPQMVYSLCKTNLEKIPSEFIEIPNELDAVAFRFAEPIETKYSDNNGFSLMSKEISSPIYCRSVLLSKIKIDDFPEIKELGILDLDQLIMIVDEGFRIKNEFVDRTLCNTLVFKSLPQKTIPELIEQTINNSNKIDSLIYKTMGKRLTNLFKVVISSGFLANSPEDGLVVPDVINSDKAKLIEAIKNNDKITLEKLKNRAKNRGKNGYNIGTNEMFVTESNMHKKQSHSNDSGKELSYSHIRGGHPHAIRYGKGKSKIKIKWFRPTRVRKDLPFKLE